MKSGIYKILNITNGKFYIGSSKNLDERWRIHKVDLNRNQHYNRHLQASWNKYGSDKFKFEVIEYCELLILLEREQHYLNTLNPQYNLSPTAGSPLGYKHTEDFKIKARNRQLGIKYIEVHRDFDKWPCADGIKCRCKECKNKKRIYINSYRYTKKILNSYSLEAI